MAINFHNLLAAGYQLLEPSVVQPVSPASDTTTDLTVYLQGAYVAMFMIVITAAVACTVYYGIGYMTSTLPGVKVDAKRRLKNIALGIAIALISYLILKTINPDLLNLKLILPS